jgi:hypothetical protein
LDNGGVEMTTRAKEKLIRDWEYLDTAMRELMQGRKEHWSIGINRWDNTWGSERWNYSVYIAKDTKGRDCIEMGKTPRKAIAALRRAVEGK